MRVQKMYLEFSAGRKVDHEVALYLEAPFGSFRVLSLFAHTEHLILASIQSEGEHPDTLFLPVEMASFRITHFKVTKEKDRVVVGFGTNP